VLATAVAPSWNDIGKLAAIAVIRTALNYFLERELRHIHSRQQEKNKKHAPALFNNANATSMIEEVK
jgi:hypothetical protein